MDTESVQKVYNNYASIYDLLFGMIFEQGRMSAIKGLRLRAGDKVLEVGVGTGLSLPFFPSHCNVVGIDLSEKMLKRAKMKINSQKLSHIAIKRMDATMMAFSDNSFDSVYAAYLISAVPDPWGVLAEMKRVCRKDGSIVVVNHFKSSNKFISSIETSISPFCSKHLGFRTDLCMSFMTKDAGLKLIERRRLSPVSLWEIAVFRNLKESTWF